MSEALDAIVIGTGQAGPALAARLSAAGRKVAVIERGRFGGTCVNTGCIPTKALVASAYAAHLARRGDDFGVHVGEVKVDMPCVKARKDDISARSRVGVERWMEGLANARVIRGHARFTGPHTVSVNGEILAAEQIFINVGARPLVPDLPGLNDVPFLTSSGIMDVDFLPEHLVIVGGSYIGLEFGQMYRRFGSEVTIVEKGERLIGREDPDVSEAVLGILRAEGVNVELGADCLGVTRRADGRIALRLQCGAQSREAVGSHLLVAIGRVPNTSDLGLDAAGVRVDARGYIEVDDQLRTSVPGIWALGDCNGRGAFTHTSYNDHEIVADNLLRGETRRVTDRIVTYGLFIDPPLGRVGMTEAEVRRTGRPALIGRRPMTRVGRAVEKGETQGFMKVVVDAASRRILGAAILGVGGDEAVHALTDAMYAGVPCDVVQRAVHIHPTVSELLPTVLGELKPL